MYLGKRQEKIFKIISAAVVFTFAFSCILPKDAFAGRSSAGGGKIAEVETSDIAISVGISIGSALVGQVLSSAISTASQMTTAAQQAQTASQIAEKARQAQATAQTTEEIRKAEELARKAKEAVELAKTAKTAADFGRASSAYANVVNSAKALSIPVAKSGGIINGISNAAITTGNLFTSFNPLVQGATSLTKLSTVAPTVISGFNTYVATSQVARATSMAGQYYEWAPAVIYVASSVATGAVAGGLNPEVALAQNLSNPWTAGNMLRATAVGSIAGLGTGLGTTVVDKNWGGNKIAEGENPRALALVAGNLTGLAAGCFGRTITDFDTYTRITDAIYEQRSVEELAAKDPKVKSWQEQIKDAEGKLASYNIEINELQANRGAIDPRAIEEGYAPPIDGMSAEEINGFRMIKALDQKAQLEAEVSGIKSEVKTYIHDTYGNSWTYREITGTVDGKPSYGSNIPDHKFADAKRYGEFSPDSFRQVAPGRYAVDRIGPYVGTDVVAGRFARSLFVEPFSAQNLPGLLSDSLSIWAVDRLPENKQYLEPLVKSLVTSGTKPIFSGLINTYGWDLNRVSLLNSKTGVIESNLKYDYSTKVLASNELMVDKAKQIDDLSKTDELVKDYEANKAKIKKLEDSEANKAKIEKLGQDLERDLTKLGIKAEDAKALREGTQTPFKIYEKYVNNLSIGVVVKDENGNVVKDESGNIKKEKKDYNLFDPEKVKGLDDKGKLKYAEAKFKQMYGDDQNLSLEQKRQREEKITQFAESLLSSEVPLSEINRNLAIEQERARVESVMSDTTTTQALAGIGAGKQIVLWNNLGRDMRSGLFEALISGGIKSIFKKNFPESADNPFSQILVPYAANMTSGVVRGVAWNWGWERVTKEWQWQEKWDFVEPKAYSLKPEDRGYNFIEDKLSQKSFADDLLRWERLKYITGVSQENGLNYHKERLKWDFSAGVDGKGAWVEDPRWVITLLYPKDEIMGKPSLGESIGRSMEQANMDYLVGVFSFGRPLTRGNNPHEVYGINPENISTTAFMSYLNNLGILSGKNLTQAFVYQAREANLDAISKNVKGTALQLPSINIGIGSIPSMATIANMQPERFTKVLTTKQINSPLTITTTEGTTKFVEQIAVGDSAGVTYGLNSGIIPKHKQRRVGVSGGFSGPEPLIGPPILDEVSEEVKTVSETVGRDIWVSERRDFYPIGESRISYQRSPETTISKENGEWVEFTVDDSKAGQWTTEPIPYSGQSSGPQMTQAAYTEAQQTNQEAPRLYRFLPNPNFLSDWDADYLYTAVAETDWSRTTNEYIETVYIPIGVPGLPSTIQQFGFESAPRGKSTFWAPFANPFYDVRPQTGPSLNFLKKSGAEGSSTTLNMLQNSSPYNLQPKAPTINSPVTAVSIENTPANINENINDRNAAQEQALRQLNNHL